jgi:hypothetical protein
MTSVRRWAVVALGVVVLAALPTIVSRLPTSSNRVSAGQLLDRIEASADVAYAGFAESSGSLSLPVTTSQISEVSDLLSSRTQLRVWWRSSGDWRVDTVTLTGERDLHGTADGTWSWDYEANTATFTRASQDVRVRLPQSQDLVPGSLARRLLRQATPDEVRRLPVARIAGRDAAGVRLLPADAQSSIDHLDVWALPGNGLPVRLTAYAKGVSAAVFTTSLLDLSLSSPDPSITAFTPPPGADLREQQAPDIVAIMDQLADVRPPRTLAGLPSNDAIAAGGSVGVYGRGLTVLVAIPLPGRVARPLDDQLDRLVGATHTAHGTSVSLTPVTVFLTFPDASGQAWLLTGTVTPATVAAAAPDLPPIDRS